jgi:protein-S-isoprenylcysteine O-methyltransferase Ste14
MNALELKIPPPLVALVLGILMWLTPRMVETVGVRRGFRIGIAAGLGCVAMGIAVSGFVAFRRARTTVNPMKVGSASSLVTSGIYRFTRNPMYLGLLLMLLAWALYLYNPVTLLYLAVFVAYIDRLQIIPEERALTLLFGTDYLAYKGRVRRWF